MWCIEAKASIEFELGNKNNDYKNWGNAMFKQFIISSKHKCAEFGIALTWLGNKTYKEAISECNNKIWLNWLNENLHIKKYEIVKQGETMTITKGRKGNNYTLWHHSGLWEIDASYIGDTIKVVCEN